MLKEVFQKLDKWVEGENEGRNQTGVPSLNSEIYVIGQAALLEARLTIRLAATMDVDLYMQLHGVIRQKLEELLAVHGKKIDPVGHEAWMPKETRFDVLFKGRFVSGFAAQPEYILISKAKMAPEKNKNLIVEYLGTQPTPLFLELARKYGINLEGFLK